MKNDHGFAKYASFLHSVGHIPYVSSCKTASKRKIKTVDQICVSMGSQFNFYVDVEFVFLGRYSDFAVYRYKGTLCRYKGLILHILCKNVCA